MKAKSCLKKDIYQHQVESNRIKDTLDKSDISNEFKDQKEKKEKKVKIQLEKKRSLNLKRKKQFKQCILKTIKSFNKNNNALNLESNNKIEKLNRPNSKTNDIDYPKSSLNVMNYLNDGKSFINFQNTACNVSLHNIDKSFNNKGKLNKTKNNFLQLINPNNKNKAFNKFKYSAITKNNFVENLEEESLNLIEKNIQNRLLNMGKEAEFLEFEITSLEMSINRLNLKKNKQMVFKKRTKKEEDKKKEINSFKRHKTVNHWNIFKKLGSFNSINSSFEDFPFDKSEINFNTSNKRHFSNNKLLNNLNYINMNSKRNNINNNKNNILNNYDIINKMKSDINGIGKGSSINSLLKSTYSFNSSNINRSIISSSSKRLSNNENSSSEKNIDIVIPKFKRRNGLFINMDKYRILSHKKLVYDSLDDEEIIEDAINDNFYFEPDDKIVLIIDSLILFLTIYCMFYKPLNLVLNNCNIRDTVTSLNFDNISNLFIDFIFICDLIINCFKAYYNFDEKNVTKSEKIIFNYMKKYFIIDFICAIPYYSIIKLVVLENHKTLNNAYSMLKIL